jgi:hypothetical protein
VFRFVLFILETSYSVTLLKQAGICYTVKRKLILLNPNGGVTDSTGIVELELRFVGYVYVKTLQLNITAKNENNTFALAA